MNEVLRKKCIDPNQFTKVRYMIHSLDTEKMHSIILELVNYNPYLAVLCYLTAEVDDDFRKKLLNELHNKDIDNLHYGIMMSLALDEIGDYWQCVAILNIITSRKELRSQDTVKKAWNGNKINQNYKKSKNQKTRKLPENFKQNQIRQIEQLTANIEDWNKEDAYWVELFFRCILKNRTASAGKFLALVGKNQQTMINTNDYIEEILENGQKLFRTSPLLWLEYVEDIGLYGMLDRMGFYFNKDYGRLIYYKSYSNRSRNAFYAIGKITALGLFNKNLTPDKVREYGLDNEIHSMVRENINHACHWYNSQNNRKKTQMPIREGALKSWDIDKNGLPPEMFFYSKDNDFAWWKCDCGYSWRGSMHSAGLTCKKCGRRIQIAVQKNKRKGKKK